MAQSGVCCHNICVIPAFALQKDSSYACLALQFLHKKDSNEELFLGEHNRATVDGKYS